MTCMGASQAPVSGRVQAEVKRKKPSRSAGIPDHAQAVEGKKRLRQAGKGHQGERGQGVGQGDEARAIIRFRSKR